MKHISTNYRLYIWVRTDLDSMSPGKACAQVAHAANQFANQFAKSIESVPSRIMDYVGQAYTNWIDSAAYEHNPNSTRSIEETDGFGTTIVLKGGTEFDLRRIYNHFEKESQYHSLLNGVVTDPSYPILDGRSIVCAEVTTVCWAFVDPESFKPFLEGYLLY